MISKSNKIGTLLLVVSTLIIILAILARRFSFLTDFGPRDWFQYFIAMLGFLGVGAGLFVTSFRTQDKSSSDNAFVVLMFLGGLYVFVLGFVLVVQPRWLDLSISGVGLLSTGVGFLYFFEFHKKISFLSRTNPYFVKTVLFAWMAVLLICFLLCWGAPVEFWQILDRFGVNVDEGGLLKNIQYHLIRFFTYS